MIKRQMLVPAPLFNKKIVFRLYDNFQYYTNGIL